MVGIRREGASQPRETNASRERQMQMLPWRVYGHGAVSRRIMTLLRNNTRIRVRQFVHGTLMAVPHGHPTAGPKSWEGSIIGEGSLNGIKRKHESDDRSTEGWEWGVLSASNRTVAAMAQDVNGVVLWLSLGWYSTWLRWGVKAPSMTAAKLSHSSNKYPSSVTFPVHHAQA